MRYNNIVFMYLLFCYSLISVSLTDQPNQDWVLIPNEGQGSINKFIKNANVIRMLNKEMERLNIKCVLYTLKPRRFYEKILRAIDEKMLDNWIFIEEDNKKYSGITANRAFLSKETNICFGEGFEQTSIKNKLRLAVCSALRVNKSEIIILESTKEEAELAKKDNFPFVFLEIINPEDLDRLVKDIQISKKNNEQLLLKEQQMYELKTIQQQVKRSHNVINIFSIQLICRTPFSKSISSNIVKNIHDNKLYVVKTDRTRQSGGELHAESLQNIQFFTDLSNFCSFNMLPHFRIPLNIKNSLIPSYEKKKAVFLIKPYVKFLHVLNQDIKDQNNFNLLMKKGLIEQKKVKGLGRIILMSLLCCENTLKKGLIQMVGYVDNQSSINVFRFDAISLFDLQNIKKQQINRISQKYWNFPLKQVSGDILNEMQELFAQIQDKIQLIRGLFCHYKWEFSKNKILKIFQDRLIFVKKIFGFNKEIKQKMSPLHYNLVIKDEFQWFTKKSQLNKSFQQFFQNRQNQYLQLMKGKKSFQIYSTLPQITRLLKWIGYKWGQVEYLSLLVNKQQAYQDLSKKLKLQSQTDKKVKFIVVDHCQLSKGIQLLHRSVRTIFISRFHKIEEQNLDTISQSALEGGQLQNTKEELFKAIIHKRILNYETYLEILEIWIKNKAAMYFIDEEKALKKCRQVYNAVTKKSNRISQLQSCQLYALPIYKQHQKIHFIHDIQSFLSFHYLIKDIMQKKWNGNFQTEQFNNFKKWIEKSSLKQTIQKQIIQFIDISQNKTDSLKILQYLSPQRYLKDILQYNYNQIIQVVSGDNIYAVHTRENMFFYDWSFQNTSKLYGIKSTIHKLNIRQENIFVQRLIVNQNNYIGQIQFSILDKSFKEISKWTQTYKQSYSL